MFILDVCVCVTVTVKFNIASMETQTQMHRMGLNPFLTFSIDTMLNLTVTLTQMQTSSGNTALVHSNLFYTTSLVKVQIRSDLTSHAIPLCHVH